MVVFTMVYFPALSILRKNLRIWYHFLVARRASWSNFISTKQSSIYLLPFWFYWRRKT